MPNFSLSPPSPAPVMSNYYTAESYTGCATSLVEPIRDHNRTNFCRDSGYPPIGFDGVNGCATATAYSQGPQPQYTSPIAQPGYLTVPGTAGDDLTPTTSNSSGGASCALSILRSANVRFVQL